MHISMEKLKILPMPVLGGEYLQFEAMEAGTNEVKFSTRSLRGDVLHKLTININATPLPDSRLANLCTCVLLRVCPKVWRVAVTGLHTTDSRNCPGDQQLCLGHYAM